jgi:pyrimidine operon attenuation protein/uracil phosphoribosyltransferase
MAAAPPFRPKLELMDAARMARTLSRIAHEIVERHPDMKGVALVGVRSRGVPLARRLARLLGQATGAPPVVGALDITLYRDDFTMIAAQPVTKGTDIPFSIDGRTVVVVDDVLFTGRTVRAALDQIIDFGRPARIELAVLVDRGHRELPVRADYAGKTMTTARDEVVQVMLTEEDGRDAVMLLERGPAPTVAAAVARTKRAKPGTGEARTKSAARSARTTAASRPKARGPRR